ncbi:hypothetical protein LEMLEM_LOCUS23969, partial [Lemmus lemmus]
GSGFRVCQVAREKGDLAKRGEGTEPGKREPKERVDEQAHRYDAVDLSGTVGIVQTDHSEFEGDWMDYTAGCSLMS